jgi:predicted nuclease of restriction endonuclease-like (RecB) superfamily
VQKTIGNNWSRAVLTHQIELGLFQHQGKAQSNFEKAYLLFDEAMQMDSEKLSQLEKEGIKASLVELALLIISRFCPQGI